MDIIKYKDITILLDSKSNYYGFKEIATLILGYTERAKTSIQYYNRSWQTFTYQSVIIKLLNMELESIEKTQKEIYKESNNIKRITKEKEKEILKICNSIKYYKQLKELKKRVNSATSLYQLQKSN